VNEKGEKKEEVFDMVVLSIGLMPPADAKDMAERLDIALDRYDFAATRCLSPIETSRPGIYVCGAFQGPKDIPGTVMEASAAANTAMGLLAPVRNSRVKKKEYPVEKEIVGEKPRIGVFVCH
jgi:heterodisulfide reductase subunit A-like polyferredoxin